MLKRRAAYDGYNGRKTPEYFEEMSLTKASGAGLEKVLTPVIDDVTKKCRHRSVEPLHVDWEGPILVLCRCVGCGVLGVVDSFDLTFVPINE